MASATASPGLHVECENIIIKRRRKRLLPLDFALPDEGHFVPLSPVSDGIQKTYPLSGDVLALEGCDRESSPVLSQICSRSESVLPIPTNHGGQAITVHGFLQDVSARSRAGRKYGRRNRLATVKLDAYSRSEHCRSLTPGPSLTPSISSSFHAETRDDQLEPISAYYPSIQSKHERLSRRVPRARRKKQLAKSLAQRLFEADVFSSGTSYRPMSDRDPAHTSSRRPLQFITSLNLTPSLESSSRIICQKIRPHHGKATRASESAAVADPEIRAAVFRADDPAPGTSPSNCLGVATLDGQPSSSRNRNGAATRRTRTGAPAALVSRKRAFRPTRGGQSSAARVQPSPLEYVPLPLVLVELAPRLRSYANDQCRSGSTVQGGRHACGGVKANFQLMSPSNLAAVCDMD